MVKNQVKAFRSIPLGDRLLLRLNSIGLYLKVRLHGQAIPYTSLDWLWMYHQLISMRWIKWGYCASMALLDLLLKSLGTLSL